MNRKYNMSFFVGGHGGWGFLRAMRYSPHIINVLIACADDGTSNGRIVKFYGGRFPPPGDITTLLGAVSRLEGDEYRTQQQVLQYKYPFGEHFPQRSLRALLEEVVRRNELEGKRKEIFERAEEFIPLNFAIEIPELGGHRFGNLALVGAMETYGVLEGISRLVQFVDGYASLIPSSRVACKLHWEYIDGSHDCGEAKLDVDIPLPISNTWLEVYGNEGDRDIPVFEEGLKAIANSDILMVGAGSIIGSSMASIPPAYQDAISKTSTPLVYQLNANREINQAAWPLSKERQIGLSVVDHCIFISGICGRPVTHVWVHDWDRYPIKQDLITTYVAEGSLPLIATPQDEILLRSRYPGVPIKLVFGDLLCQRYDPKASKITIRHSSDKRRIPREFRKLLKELFD